MTFQGKNLNFVVQFDCNKQEYTVFYKNKFLIKCFSFSEAYNYLN